MIMCQDSSGLGHWGNLVRTSALQILTLLSEKKYSIIVSNVHQRIYHIDRQATWKPLPRRSKGLS